MKPEIVAKREELAAKTKQLSDIFAEAKMGDGKLSWKQVKSISGGPEAVQAEVERRGAELTALKGELDVVMIQDRNAELEAWLNAPAGSPTLPGRAAEPKSVGEQFTDSVGFKAYKQNRQMGVPMDIDVHPAKLVGGYGVKTTMATSTAWAPQAIRTDIVIPFATRPIQVLDLIPAGTSDQAAVVYMEETTFTNAAAETTENNAYPEAALAFTQRTSTHQKIAVFIPVTDEQLEDVPQVQGYVNRRLEFMLRQRLDGQALVGNGTPPNIVGVLNASNLQTQAKSSDPTFDALFKGYIKVAYTGFAVPSGFVMNPTDWQNLRLTRTAEGIYILGNPDQLGMTNLFGLPVAVANALTQGTAVVGDFANFSEIAYRHGINLQVGYINDDFKLGKKSIRAEVRCTTVWYRGAAFCQVTGL